MTVRSGMFAVNRLARSKMAEASGQLWVSSPWEGRGVGVSSGPDIGFQVWYNMLAS